MMPVWPSELDLILQQGWQQQAGEARRRTANDAGPPRISRRYSQVARPVAMTLDMSRAEKARFDRFYFEEVREGTLPFLMRDPLTSGWELLADNGAALLTDGSAPLLLEETWICLFGTALPAETAYGARILISFELAVMP